MLSRLLLSLVLLLALAVSASSQNLSPLTDPKLQKAAQRLKAKDYRGAWDSMQGAADSPEKRFMAGIAALRLEQWTDAAELLGRASRELPSLGDYALFGQAEACQATARHDEALDAVKMLLAGWPESPLVRKARLLQADILFGKGEFREALAAYVRFVELYPTGNDSITALHQAALCREGLHEEARAVQELRSLWLTYPGSPVAEKVDDSLQRLARKGFPAAPYTADELLRRGSTLYNLGKYEQALKNLDAVPLQGQSADFAARVSLKTGQTLFKARKYKDAQRVFAALLDRELKPAVTDEIRYWHAKSLDKCSREDEAFTAYLGIQEKSPASELADDALLEAAFIRKFQGRYQDELPVLDRLIAATSDSKLKQRATWESAWARYNSRDFRGAADAFNALISTADYRERALYWHGRALERTGDAEAAARSFGILTEEYPFSFYASQLRTGNGTTEAAPRSLPQLISALPVPAGFDRVKALISFGLHDEARRELAAAKKNSNGKKKTLLGLARLHLEMDDYASAAAIMRAEAPRRIDADSLLQWGLLYPRAFSDAVSEQTAEFGVSDELVYSLMKAESGFAPGAVSPVGAIGLMQLMPATARTMVANGAKNGVAARLPDPKFNISLGVRHLRDLLKQYNGNVVSAVAAYNAGSNAVDRWRKNLAFCREDEFIENIPYYETREYVKKVLAGAEIYRRLYRSPLPASGQSVSAIAEPQPQAAPSGNILPTSAPAEPAPSR